MPNYFFADSSGQRLGPINEQQLQALAARGTITPETVLETDTGHRGKAHQIPGLVFPGQSTSNTVPLPNGTVTRVMQLRYRSDTEETPIFSLLFDFSFRELRPETVFLWITKIAYATGLTVTILATIFYCGSTIYMALRAASVSNGISLLTLLTIPFICIGGFLVLCLLRLACDYSIIVIHCTFIWMLELVKLLQSARVYLEMKSKR